MLMAARRWPALRPGLCGSMHRRWPASGTRGARVAAAPAGTTSVHQRWQLHTLAPWCPRPRRGCVRCVAGGSRAVHFIQGNARYGIGIMPTSSANSALAPRPDEPLLAQLHHDAMAELLNLEEVANRREASTHSFPTQRIMLGEPLIAARARRTTNCSCTSSSWSRRYGGSSHGCAPQQPHCCGVLAILALPRRSIVVHCCRSVVFDVGRSCAPCTDTPLPCCLSGGAVPHRDRRPGRGFTPRRDRDRGWHGLLGGWCGRVLICQGLSIPAADRSFLCSATEQA